MELNYRMVRALARTRLSQIEDAALEHPQYTNERKHLLGIIAMIDAEIINQKQYLGWVCPSAVGTPEEVGAIEPNEAQKVKGLPHLENGVQQ